MTQSEQGEHELVLGNKQLLSAFFVVVFLLGVFFTMGYFVGKNSATSGYNQGPAMAAGTRPDAAGKPLEAAQGSTPAPEATSPVPDPAPPTESRSTATTAPPVEQPKAEPAPVTETEHLSQPTGELKYLQVSAIRRPDADNMVKVLKERGFPALLGESSKQGLYRVLVGPFKTTSELGHAKADLKAKGFESIVAK
jgi:cell division septation protein DedD